MEPLIGAAYRSLRHKHRAALEARSKAPHKTVHSVSVHTLTDLLIFKWQIARSSHWHGDGQQASGAPLVTGREE